MKITDEDMEFIHAVLVEYAKSIAKIILKGKKHIITMSTLAEKIKECEEIYLKFMRIKKFFEELKQGEKNEEA